MCMWERKSRRENGRERHWYTLGRNIYLHVYVREREIEGKRERSWRNIYISRCLREREREERERMREERQRERDVLFWISITTYEIPITLRLTHQRKSEGWFMRSFCVVFVYVWSATSLCRSWHTNQPACHNHNSFCNRKLQIFLMQYWWRKYKKWKLCMYRSIIF